MLPAPLPAPMLTISLLPSLRISCETCSSRLITTRVRSPASMAVTLRARPIATGVTFCSRLLVVFTRSMAILAGLSVVNEAGCPTGSLVVRTISTRLPGSAEKLMSCN